MTWQTEMVPIIRYLVNDSDSTNYTFTDERLEGTILVGAQLLLNEIDFDDPPGNTYVVDVDALDLSPDPTTSGNRDDAFISLVSLKTACIILGSEIRTSALNSIVVKDGPSTIDMRGALAGLQLIYQDMCTKFDQAVMQYKAGNSRVGQAILSPYSPGSENISRPYSGSRYGYFGGY